MDEKNYRFLLYRFLCTTSRMGSINVGRVQIM